MLGFFVEVHQQKDGGEKPATMDSPLGTKLSLWASGMNGVDWLMDLAKAGKAIDLGGGGYPWRFTITVKELLVFLLNRETQWTHDDKDFSRGPWGSKTFANSAGLDECKGDEWLIVDCWDES